MRHDIASIAKNSLLLKNAPAQLVDPLLEGARVTQHARGETIFIQDDPADAIYIVARGWIKLYRIAANGSEAVVGTFTNGHSFGEAVALRSDRYPVSAEAVTECELIAINAHTLIRLLESNPKIAISMLTATYAHLHNLVDQVEQLKSRTAPQRVAEFLLELSDCDDGGCTVTLPYDKMLIAGRLGMKPESLSRAFAKLKEQGVKVRQNAAEITDVEALRAYVEEDPAAAWSR
ncbi:Crp/Fnr family transcriptional regulator [Celeribacter neptunius]|uniref:cAMP-binding domain of CRP or a regulatory subunit of cAMP-dependent protein kinases n=1 Tax=Celeribacter neptunius TaxID=588602 RepID=A0A1I3R4Z1_9RHOB|nr:Crp/Fnr family transcriptional regulator [Celeribacter neptunius]SFJ41683.1 cAMP-binding domain of CRP or a regulatory subunit of cAMP-dependent protein kinases [Celeribacter neptunius]